MLVLAHAVCSCCLHAIQSTFVVAVCTPHATHHDPCYEVGCRAEQRGGGARGGQASADACDDDCACEVAGGCVWRAVALGVGTAGARRVAGGGGQAAAPAALHGVGGRTGERWQRGLV